MNCFVYEGNKSCYILFLKGDLKVHTLIEYMCKPTLMNMKNFLFKTLYKVF